MSRCSEIRLSSSHFFITSCLLALCALGCDDPKEESPPLEIGEVFAEVGEAVPFASAAQLESFERGKEAALRRFTPEEGLGPKINVSFCGSCHEKPVLGGSAPRYRNFQLIFAQLSDGSVIDVGVNGILTQFDLGSARPGREPTDEHASLFATRNPIPFFGVGLLAELDEEEILKRSDPNDRDGDGISGRPNWDRGFVGRFGRKAQTVSIEGFIRGPLFNHMGITSNPLSDALKAQLPVPSVDEGAVQTRTSGLRQANFAQAAAPSEPIVDDDDAPDPELSEQELFDLVSFAMLLAPPTPSPSTEQTMRGEALFDDARCTACHVPALAGPRGLIPAYTDLLIHDMGESLDDGVVMGEAKGSEFRTSPLWGVAATGPYLHDGRADTLAEAILAHDGEAKASRDVFAALSSDEQADIVAFLVGLGGEASVSSGLLSPNTPVPAAGEYGGPSVGLSGAEAERYARGREVFDRDIAYSEGLGPRFNGDSCRACHFDPVIGGAGPLDLSVTRQGILLESGAFEYPAMGTMAHRFGELTSRPPIDAQANISELRQTPAVFGIGLIDRIPADDIIARADPDDLDGDGISGRAHMLMDGRLGRFGWKADVPSVEEFMRDALSNELGTSLPERAGQSFGALSDGDAVPDPEISDADYDDMLFFLQAIAPPPRQSTDAALESAGAAVFESAGCVSCHTASMQTEDGVAVGLYSDLLLHEMLPGDASGIESGDAGMREFRTPPLWGISRTAPYLHDGSASTLDAAIEGHDGEGTASRDAWRALSESDRAALRAFLESL